MTWNLENTTGRDKNILDAIQGYLETGKSFETPNSSSESPTNSTEMAIGEIYSSSNLFDQVEISPDSSTVSSEI